MRTLQLRLAADHPAAQGHFPGNPIIPGAVLLSTALTEVASALQQDFAQCRVSSAKFPSPARPGDCVDVEYAITGARLVLLCTVARRTVLKAELAYPIEHDLARVKAAQD